MRNAPALVVLAAGLGSRYGSDKQLAGIGPGGEPILYFTALDAATAGFGELILVVRPELEPVTEELFGQRLRGILPIRYVHQITREPMPGLIAPATRSRPWGTAHALAVALADLDVPCGVVNADDWYGPPSLAELAGWLRGGEGDACLTAFRLGRTLSPHGTVNRGVVLTAAGQLRQVTEVEGLIADADGAVDGAGTRYRADTLVSMNLWGLRPRIYTELRAAVQSGIREHRDDPRWECQLPSIIMNGLHALDWHIACQATAADWCGITYPDDRPAAQARIQAAIAAGAYPTLAAVRKGHR